MGTESTTMREAVELSHTEQIALPGTHYGGSRQNRNGYTHRFTRKKSRPLDKTALFAY